MLTTCPNCLHVFDHGVATFNNPSSSCCASRPVLLSATLQLPPTSVPTTCTVAVSTVSHPRVLAGMAGGGIVDTTFFVDQQGKAPDQQSTSAGVPQPSPSTPLSFVLPSPTTNASAPRVPNLMPFQWTASVQPMMQIAPWMMNTVQPAPPQPSRETVIPQVPQSETDLVRLAATLNALRASGWYYEGLSWQESQEALQSTPPGTFLVRDSSDPRFLFSLSVQTERGPTSIRLHYVMGQFRLDAEPRLAPMMPLFECVVKLVEYYIALTKDSRSSANKCNRKTSRDKEQVWVDARGQLYSHILLTSPLYKKHQRPSLQHLARLAINKQMLKTTTGLQGVALLPLPAPLKDYLKEYPYTH
ncbi:cytokine-inducible SH2-containing protein [Anabrus simplex]|uniref:cytokine-inducible SH2-containing protein n=1 Tax=Anabrus simplex TaxID=316456 RepID=UPI0034DD51CF